jgi:hypothetical protein
MTISEKKENCGVQLDDTTYRVLRLERAARVSGDRIHTPTIPFFGLPYPLRLSRLADSYSLSQIPSPLQLALDLAGDLRHHEHADDAPPEHPFSPYLR